MGEGLKTTAVIIVSLVLASISFILMLIYSVISNSLLTLISLFIALFGIFFGFIQIAYFFYSMFDDYVLNSKKKEGKNKNHGLKQSRGL
jgi:uncharacterized Tic20 family protein